MPSVTSPSTILLTGGSGFIGAHVLVTLNKKGHTVVAAVRKESQGEYLKQLVNGRNFEYAIVPKIEESNAYDQVVSQHKFDAIVHIASPVGKDMTTPDEVITPAVEGTINILKAALKFGPTVKRLIITSSLYAVAPPPAADYKASSDHVYTGDEWNDLSVKRYHEQGDKTDGLTLYAASKALSEKAAWDLVKEHKDEVKFDLVTLIPSYVWGPVVHETSKDPSSLRVTPTMMINMVKTYFETEWNLSTIDVRDLAEAYSHLLESEQAGGERFIISSSNSDMRTVKESLANENIPGVAAPGKSTMPPDYLITNDKLVQATGLKFRDIKETVVDGLRSSIALFPDILKQPASVDYSSLQQ